MGTSFCSGPAQSISILIMVIIRVISILLSPVFISPCFYFVESGFSFESLFLVLIEGPVVCSHFRFTYDVLIDSFSDMIFYPSIVAFFS